MAKLMDQAQMDQRIRLGTNHAQLCQYMSVFRSGTNQSKKV